MRARGRRRAYLTFQVSVLRGTIILSDAQGLRADAPPLRDLHIDGAAIAQRAERRDEPRPGAAQLAPAGHRDRARRPPVHGLGCPRVRVLLCCSHTAAGARGVPDDRGRGQTIPRRCRALVQPRNLAIQVLFAALYLLIGGTVLYLAVRGLGIGHVSFWQALAVIFSLAF